MKATGLSVDGGPIVSFAYYDGKLAVGSSSGKLVIFDSFLSKVIFETLLPSSPVTISMSYDLSAAWLSDGTVYLFSNSGKQIFSVKVSSDFRFSTFNFSGLKIDGKDDGSIYIQDAKSGKVLKYLKFGKQAIPFVWMSDDGVFLVTYSLDEVVRIYNLKTDEMAIVLDRTQTSPQFVSTDPSGSFLASGGLDGALKIWNLKNGEIVDVIQAHSYGISCVLFAERDVIITGDFSGEVKIWNLDLQEDKKSDTKRKKGFFSFLYSAFVIFLLYFNSQSIDFAFFTDLPPYYRVEEEREKGGSKRAGEISSVFLNVKNLGPGSSYLHIAYENRIEKYFFHPNDERTIPVRFYVPINWEKDYYNINVDFWEAKGFYPEPLSLKVDVVKSPVPLLSFESVLDDSPSDISAGDGDGKLERGEIAKFLIKVKNVGEGVLNIEDIEIVSPFNIRNFIPDVKVLESNRSFICLVVVAINRNSEAKSIPISVNIRDKTFGIFSKSFSIQVF